MAGPVITISVLSDSSRAQRDLKDMGDAADGAGHKFELSAGKIAAAAAGVVAGGAAIGFLTSSVQAAAEDDSQQKLFEQQLKTAGASDEIVEAFNKQIAAGEKLKGFTDTDLRQAYSQFYQQSRNVEQSQKDVSLAMDIARAAGVPLTQAVDALNKAHDGNSKSLAALLPQYTDLIKNTKDSNVVLDTLTTAVQGQADVWANSSEGRLERAKIQYGELKESIGAKLLPVIGQLASFLTDNLLPAFDRTSEFISQHKQAVEALAIAIGVVLLPVLAAAVVEFVAMAAPVVAVTLAIGALVLGVMELVEHWGDVTAFLHDLASWDNLKRVVLDFATLGLAEVERHFHLIDQVAGPIIDGIHGGIDGIADAVGWLIHQVEVVTDKITHIPGVGAIRRVGGAIGSVTSHLNPFGAEGAIVSRPTVALIGEAGPEALIPLNRTPGNSPLPSSWGGGNTYVTYYPTGYNRRAIVDAQRKWNRLNGVTS